MTLYRPLSEISLGDTAEFGGKAARLGEAMRLGCSVLPGVALSAELYRRFMRQGGLQGEVRSILATMQPQTLGQFQAAEWAIRSAFEVRRIPDDVVAVIHEAWDALSADLAAVRSSATNEDSPHQSFVGQHAYTPDVTDAQAAVQAVLACWQSLFSAQALSYANNFGVDLLSSAMAVLIQPMVDASSQGALFTVDPVTGNPDVIILSVHKGPSSGVYVMDPYVRSPGEEPAWSHLREMGLLLDAQELAYQSLDWVVVEGQVYLLRARPVTGAPPYLPQAALACASNARRHVWLHEPGIAPRAARPLSWYHQSRGPSLHAAHHALPVWAPAAPELPAQCYPCGYLYACDSDSDGPSHDPIMPMGRLLSDLRLALRARKLDQGYLTLRERDLPRLEALSEQDLVSLTREELAEALAETMALHNAFARERGLLERADAALTDMLSRLSADWLSGDRLDLDLLLWTGEDARAQTEEPLANLAQAAYGSDEERQAAMETHIARHGHRFVEGELLAPWRDLADLAPSHALLEEAWRAAQERESAPGHARQERRQARDQAAEALMQRLGRARGKILRWLLALGRRYRTLARDCRNTLVLCRVLEPRLLREVGRRLHAAGLVSSEQDAALFGCREILDWLRGQTDDDTVVRAAQQRAATRRRWARYSPPEEIEPVGEPDLESDKARAQWLTGRAICAGRVSGRARVIQSMSEASQLLPGEILVCQELPFELTPLFSIASAVVAEGGDLLDHASVLAREYGAPTVFGVAEATRRIQTGDSLLVDASRGVVVLQLPESDWDLWAI